MTESLANVQLKQLEQAREKLAKQIENSQAALKELDAKIARLTKELTESHNSAEHDR